MYSDKSQVQITLTENESDFIPLETYELLRAMSYAKLGITHSRP
jgi:hypothetical protein